MANIDQARIMGHPVSMWLQKKWFHIAVKKGFIKVKKKSLSLAKALVRRMHKR